MKNLLLLLSVFLIMSCGSQYQLSTLNHQPEYIGDVRVDVIDNEMELSRKLRFDDKFRWDFAQYAMRQDYRWNYDFYWNNRMYRRGPFASPSDFYWNSQAYWWNWASNSHFNYGFNHWDPFGFNNYGMGWSYSWNNRRWSSNQWGNPYGWDNRYGWNTGFYNRYRGTNVAYNRGRRATNRSGRWESTTPVKRVNPRTRTNVTPIPNNTRVREVRSSEVRVIKPRRVNTVIPPVRNNRNTTPIRNYNNRPTNNSRSVRTNIPTTSRRSSTPIRTKGRGNN